MATMGKPLGQRIKNTVTLGAMSQEQLAVYWNGYLASVGLGRVAGKDSFDTYLENKINGVDKFATIKDADGKPISDKLQTDPELVAKLEDVFSVTPETTEAKDKFNTTLFNMEKEINDLDGFFQPASYLHLLQGVKAAAVTAIQAQQKKEIDALNAKFDASLVPNEFRDQIKATMGFTTEDEVNKVKEDMFGAIKKSHAAEMKQFEDELNKSLENLSKALAGEYDRISFLGDRYERDKRMRAAIDEIAKRKQQELGPHIPTTVGINADTGYAHLKNVRVQDLPFIHTITGRTITNNGDGSYALQLSKDWIYFDRKVRDLTKSVEKDLTSLAHTIKACGEEAITMDINCKDPEKAKELGRKAYEACIVAGFEPKDININVNGQLMSEQYDATGKLTSADKLFEEEPTRLAKAKHEAVQIAKEREGRALDTPAAKAEVAALKKELLVEQLPEPTTLAPGA
jgi:hypothetical protein